MDRGSERDTPPGRGTDDIGAGRIPLAVVVVDRDGLVSHWSSGARRLLGVAKEEAIGRPALDLLPVSGAFREDDPTVSHRMHVESEGLGPDLESSLDGHLSYPAAGCARLTVEGRDRTDVLWWGYPLMGPGRERLLVLATDAARLRDERGHDPSAERIAPGFARYTDFPSATQLARRLAEILPSMSVGGSARIVAQVLELGHPVLEFSQNARIPVIPDWGVPRWIERRVRRERAQRVAAQGLPVPPELTDDEGQGLEYAAVRARLELLTEVSGRIAPRAAARCHGVVACPPPGA